MAIATATEYKVWAGISGSTYDSVIAVIIAGVQDEMEDYCGRLFDYDEARVSLVDGTDSAEIVIPHTPISSISTLRAVTPSGDVVISYTSSQYTYDQYTGVLTLANSKDVWIYEDGDMSSPVFDRSATSARFPRGFRNIRVAYGGGYGDSPAVTTMPDSLKLALYKLVDMQMAMRGKDTSLASENLGQYSYSRAQGVGGNLIDYQKMLASLMAPWRRLGVIA